jgi:hypothetical protein
LPKKIANRRDFYPIRRGASGGGSREWEIFFAADGEVVKGKAHPLQRVGFDGLSVDPVIIDRGSD